MTEQPRKYVTESDVSDALEMLGKGHEQETMKIVWVEFSLATIVSYFVEGFKEKIVSHEFYIDPVKGKVVFKLYTKDKGAEK